MLNLMRKNRGVLLASALVVATLGMAPVATAIQLVCKADVEKVLHNSRDGVVGLRAQILDDTDTVVAVRIWKLCYTEISDGLHATLPADVNDWTSEQDCQNVLDILNIAKALDRPIEIVFREAPDNIDPAIEAQTCEEVRAKDPILFRHLHQVSWGG